MASVMINKGRGAGDNHRKYAKTNAEEMTRGNQSKCAMSASVRDALIWVCVCARAAFWKVCDSLCDASEASRSGAPRNAPAVGAAADSKNPADWSRKAPV